MNAEAIIQAGTRSWRAFSSQTVPEPQQFALCCSFIRRVIFVFLPLGEQDSFCFQSPFESSLLRIWFSREKPSWPAGFAPTLSGAEKQRQFHCRNVGVAHLLGGKVTVCVPWEFIPAPLLLGFGYLVTTDNYLEIMRYLHLWFTGSCLYCFPGAESCAGCFVLSTNNWRP